MAYELLIRESHLDSFGHVNNAMYLTLFEEARWDLITQQGYGYKEVHSSGQGPVILEAHMKFVHELGLREKVFIHTELIKYEGKIGQLKQTLLREDGKLSCECIFTFGLFDLKTRKLILPTEKWLKALKP